MLPIKRIAQARSLKARNQRFMLGMTILFLILALYSAWPPKSINSTASPVPLGLTR
jgi:hypothetical protein